MRAAGSALIPRLLILALGVGSFGCTSSSGGSFASNDPGMTGTVVSGKSDTAGLSAGAALVPPPTPTKSS
jgi:hypothetical protein